MSSLFGLIVCGGESSRMGMDKSLLVYYDKPQRYHQYDIVKILCNQVFISCNNKQASTIQPDYNKIVDNERYENIGPMAALLSAFAEYPNSDFLVIACDYPFIKFEDIQILIESKDKRHLAYAYFNESANIKEPLLAIYSKECYPLLIHQFNRKEYSLRQFLVSIDAKKVLPRLPEVVRSIDTPEAFHETLLQIQQEALHAPIATHM